MSVVAAARLKSLYARWLIASAGMRVTTSFLAVLAGARGVSGIVFTISILRTVTRGWNPMSGGRIHRSSRRLRNPASLRVRSNTRQTCRSRPAASAVSAVVSVAPGASTNSRRTLASASLKRGVWSRHDQAPEFLEHRGAANERLTGLRDVGWPGRRQQKRLVAQIAAEPRVALAPRLEAPGDRVEQLGLARRRFPHGARLKNLAPSSAYQRMLCRRRI